MESPTDRTASGATLAVVSVASVQFGASLAAHLFGRIGPVATVSLRLTGAALVLLAICRPWQRAWTRAELRAALAFGGVFTVMNVSLYEALDRLPQATVITLEFLGPLVVALISARTWSTRAWALPAGAGVALIGGGLSGHSIAGVAFALFAAACWAGYIVLSGRLGRSGTGLPGLAVGCIAASVVMLPIGAASAGEHLVHPSTLVLGLAVGVLSSAIPYSLDLLALRRLPTAVFGVLTSLNPGVAALAGLLVLGQRPPALQLFGVACVTVASAGVTLTPFLRARRGAPRRSRSATHESVETASAKAFR